MSNTFSIRLIIGAFISHKTLFDCAIARQNKPVSVLIVQGHREHAVEMLREIALVLLVEMDNNFSVSVRAKCVAGGGRLGER